MAEEQVGPRPAAWTKIFTGFKVALDLKKLLLAAAGVLTTAIGWWFLSIIAYGFPGLSNMPEWKEEGEDRTAAFKSFLARRKAWNLLHELAGDVPMRVELADVAQNYQEYTTLQKIKLSYDRFHDEKLQLNFAEKEAILVVDKLKGRTFFVRELRPLDGDAFSLGDLTITVPNSKELREYRELAVDLPRLEEQYRGPAIDAFKSQLLKRTEKPAGRLRTLPWFENRGENPYLLVARLIKESSGSGSESATPRGHFVAAFRDLIPVLLEPIVKILTPIVYLFDQRADWYVRGYLLFVLFYALAVWGFFGGAITRLAAVQVARNEKIPLREAIAFAKDRFVSFFAAPAFPLLLLGILVFCLWLFGWVEGYTFWFGDIVIAGLLWPIVLIVGLIMAVVLVGLVGWPLMNPTISAEGSDSFDALSRSYSYVYQSPWHYLWYGALATLYGMALVFFVGFMASLIVFLGKWSVSMTPGIGSNNPKNDREPSYLFIYAPTSFGWRDLLISNSSYAEVKTTPGGATSVELSQPYLESISIPNKIGAALVAIWIWLFFLLVVGFGYSYFWTAATIVYFLMRRHVDDTDMDEVHLEEDEALDPFARPPGAAPGPPPAKSDKVSLSVVEPPRTDGPPPTAPIAPPAPPVSTAIQPSEPPPPAAPPADSAPPPNEPPPASP
jgi:hypothetical protein